MAGSSPAGRPGWLIVAAPTLLLLTPFVIFVRHHAYPLHSPEILGCVLLLSVVGGTLGALAYRFPAVAPLIIAGSIVGLVDLQFYVPVPIEGIGEMTALLAGLVVLAAVLRYSPGWTLTLVGLMAAAVFASTLVTPAARLAMDESGGSSSGSRGPFVLHLIFDEHIGPAGLRGAGRADAAERLRGFFEHHGFLVFDAAYSEHDKTVEAVGHTLDLVSGRYVKELVETSSSESQNRLIRSRYFAALGNAGYDINVYQSDYLDLCHTNVRVASCHTYANSKLGVLRKTTLTVSERASLVLGVFLTRSDFRNELREHYQDVRDRVWPTLPSWDWGQDTKVSTIATVSTLERLESDLARARRGLAVVSHLLLPHAPYVYDDTCAMRRFSDWVRNDWWKPSPPDVRALRYEKYADQVVCTQLWVARLLQAIPEDVRRDAVVIVHGDHGSRILASAPPTSPSGVADATSSSEVADMDRYSTLFAIRSPAIPAGQDLRQSSVQCLLAELTATQFKAPPGADACTGDPAVVRADADHEMRPLQWFNGRMPAP